MAGWPDVLSSSLPVKIQTGRYFKKNDYSGNLDYELSSIVQVNKSRSARTVCARNQSGHRLMGKYCEAYQISNIKTIIICPDSVGVILPCCSPKWSHTTLVKPRDMWMYISHNLKKNQC